MLILYEINIKLIFYNKELQKITKRGNYER